MGITVPRYDEAQINPASAPTPRAQGLGPEAFGAGLARGLGAAGQEMAQVARQEREKEELTALNDSKLGMSAFRSELLDGRMDQSGNMQGGLLNLKRSNAKGLESQAAEKWKQKAGEYSEQLKNYPAAQTLFNQWAQQSWIETATSLNKHEIRERQAAAVDSQRKIIEQQSEDLIKQAGGGVTLNFSSLDGSVSTLGQLNGYDPDSIENLKKDARSKVVSIAIQRQFDSGEDDKIKQGIALFDQYKDSMTLEDRHAMEPHIVKVKQIDEGETKAKDIWGRLGPKGLNDSINSVAMDKEVEKIKNRDVRGYAEREINSMSSKWNRTQSEFRQANVSEVYGMILAKKSPKSILSSSAYANLPKDAQFSLKNIMESEYGIGGRGGGGASREEMRVVQGEMLANYQDMIEDGQLIIKDPKEVYALADKLGFGNTTKLFNFVNRHNKTLKKMPFTKDVFNDTLREMLAQDIDFVPDPDNRKDKSNRANIAILYDKVTKAVENEQESHGKVLDRDGLKKVMRRLLAPTRVKSRWTLGGAFTGDHTMEKPAYQVEYESNIDVEKTLKARLGRKPTKEEIAIGKKHLRGK